MPTARYDRPFTRPAVTPPPNGLIEPGDIRVDATTTSVAAFRSTWPAASWTAEEGRRTLCRGWRSPGCVVGRGRALTEAAVAAVSVVETTATFEDLYRTHFRDLSGYCAGLLDDDALGVDFAQEAFTRLFGRLRAVREPRAWLFLVATNLVRDEWRRRARQRDAVEALRLWTARAV